MMDENLEISIIKSRRKSITLQLDGPDRLIVRAPLRASKKSILEVIEKNEDWIKKATLRMKKQEESLEGIRTFSQLELAELVNSAKRVIPERVRYYASLVGVEYGRITIRNQRTRWGSCSRQGNLNFNVALMRTPIEVLDYVVVHELCHRIEMNHSKRFWSEVERVLPDYKKHRKWLKDNGDKVLREVIGV